MANDLRTRIQLKYDVWSEWDKIKEDSTKILKAGEVAIVKVPESTTVVDGQTVTTAPTILMKVGNGTDKFKDLPWVSALAADVHEWAKDTWTNFVTKLQAAIDNGTAAYAKASDLSELATLVGTKDDEATDTTVFGKIAKAQAAADAAQQSANTANNDLSTHKQAFEAFKTTNSQNIQTAKDAADEAQADATKAIEYLKDIPNKNNTHVGAVKAYVDDTIDTIVNTYLTGEGKEQVIDTLVEVTEWITKTDGAAASLADHEGRIDELEADTHTHAKSDTDITDAVNKKHEHSNKTDLDGINSTKISNWDNAETNAKAYADGIKDEVDNTIETYDAHFGRHVDTEGEVTWDVLVFDCGNASDHWY